MNVIAYYISGHGYGHAVRSAEIIRTLQRRRPDVQVHVRGTAPPWLLPAVMSHESVELDAGVIQRDALHVDPAATLERAAGLARAAAALVEAESAFLRGRGVRLVVGDIPPPAFLAARRAGLPSVAVANFSWDWIYAPYVERRPEFGWLLAWLRDAYSRASLLLRLPFHGDLSAFRAIEDVPLVAVAPTLPRAEARAALRLDAGERAVLLGFGGLGLRGLAATALGRLRRYTFLATEREVEAIGALPPNVRLLPSRHQNYNNLIAAADAVVGKPGYGMIAACLIQRVPLLYADRGQFPEYEVLVSAIERHGRALHIPRDELLAGNLGPYLDRLLEIDRPWSPLRADGAEVIAERLLTSAADG